MSSTGRPPVFDSPGKLEQKIQDYVDKTEGDKKPLTITGLCLFLGFESRQSFYDYEKNKPFSYTVKRARLAIEESYENNLSGNTVAGSIFALKNLGWSDKQEIAVSTTDLPFSIKIESRNKADTE